MHYAEAVQEQIVTEAPADDSEPTAPAATLPSQAKVKRNAQVVPTRGTAAGEGTPSSSKKQPEGKDKQSDKRRKSDDDDADERKVYSGFSTVFLLLLLLAVAVGFPAACFWR